MFSECLLLARLSVFWRKTLHSNLRLPSCFPRPGKSHDDTFQSHSWRYIFNEAWQWCPRSKLKVNLWITYSVSLQLWSVKETRHCYKCQHIHKFPKRFVCADLSGVNPVCKQTSSWKLNKSQHCYIPKSSTVPVSTSLERAVKLYPPRLLPINRNSSVHLTNIPRSIYKWWVLSIRAIVDSKYHLNCNIPINRHWLD